MTAANSGGPEPKYATVINDVVYPMPRRVVSGSVLRFQCSLAKDEVIFRDHESPDDPIIHDEDQVDLFEGNVFYSEPAGCNLPGKECSAPPKLAIVLDDQAELTVRGDQTGQTILELFGLPLDTPLFRDFESPIDLPIGLKDPVDVRFGYVFRTKHKAHRQIKIVIHNEDDGREYEFVEDPKAKVGKVVDEFYREKLRREPRNDDRLRCEGNGFNILEHRNLDLGQVAEKHCACNEWLFASGTGGA